MTGAVAFRQQVHGQWGERGRKRHPGAAEQTGQLGPGVQDERRRTQAAPTRSAGGLALRTACVDEESGCGIWGVVVSVLHAMEMEPTGCTCRGDWGRREVCSISLTGLWGWRRG